MGDGWPTCVQNDFARQEFLRCWSDAKIERNGNSRLLASRRYNRMKDMRGEERRYARNRFDVPASPTRDVPVGQTVSGSENQRASAIICAGHLCRH
jgi:hypothetical protein